MAKNLTKSFLVTTVNAVVADTETESIEKIAVKLHGGFKDEKALEKALRFKIAHNDRPFILLKIDSVSTETKKYSMSVNYFIEHATEITK